MTDEQMLIEDKDNNEINKIIFRHYIICFYVRCAKTPTIKRINGIMIDELTQTK